MPLYQDKPQASPVTSGGITIGTTTVAGGTSGSVLFVDSTGFINQDNANFNYNDSTNILSLAGLSLPGLTAGSILFLGTGGAVEQDNSNLFWDNTNNRLGIGTTTPAAPLDINRNANVLMYLRSTGSVCYNQIQTSATGYNTTYDGFTFGVNGVDAYFFNRENAKIFFGTNDNARMIINANGYISMGINTDFRQLAVYDAANGQGVLYGYSSQTGASDYSGNLILGSSSSYMGSIDYGYGADSIFAFSNTQNNNSARIDFKLKNAGTPVTPLSIKGSGQVGFSTTSPDGSALVDMVSTTSGFLPPRMTGTEAEAIESPADGLLIFCNNGNGATITSTGWWGYDGGWVKLN